LPVSNMGENLVKLDLRVKMIPRVKMTRAGKHSACKARGPRPMLEWICSSSSSRGRYTGSWTGRWAVPSGKYRCSEEIAMSDVYVFGNGIRLRRGDIMDIQVERYSEPGNPNLHEPVEEEWILRSFAQMLPEAPV